MTAITETEIIGDAASFDVEAVTDTLTVIAAWRDALRDRIQRTRLIFELHDVDIDFQQLADEVVAFRRCCACIAWRKTI